MDSFGAFLDTQLLRVERLMRRETKSEKINRELQQEALRGVDPGEQKTKMATGGSADADAN